jgi:hypothetical protein
MLARISRFKLVQYGNSTLQVWVSSSGMGPGLEPLPLLHDRAPQAWPGAPR